MVDGLGMTVCSNFNPRRHACVCVSWCRYLWFVMRLDVVVPALRGLFAMRLRAEAGMCQCLWSEPRLWDGMGLANVLSR